MGLTLTDTQSARFDAIGDLSPATSDWALKLRWTGDQTGINDAGVLYVRDSGDVEAMRFEISENTTPNPDEFTLTCIVFHATGNKSRSCVLTNTVLADSEWHTFRLRIGSGTAATNIQIFVDGAEVTYSSSASTASGAQNPFDDASVGERFTGEGFVATYEQLVFSSGGLSAQEISDYENNAVNPMTYAGATLYRELRSDASTGKGAGTYVADGGTFDTAINSSMPDAPATFATQLLIRQPHNWPVTAAAPLQIGGGRNTNNNNDPHEEKFTFFCSRLVAGTVYHYAELLNSPVTESYLASQTDHNSTLAFTGTFARLLNPADFTNANGEAAITSVIPNPWGAGVVAFLHCGNNAGTRNIYYATSTDAVGAVGTWTRGNNGNAIISVTGGETRIADGFAVYDLATDRIRVFHRTHDAGGLSAVHLATVDSAFTATRQGAVIASSAWSAKNGVVPGQIYDAGSGIYQMYVSPNTGDDGPRHATSYDKGATWSLQSDVAATPQGGTSVPDAIGIADGISLWLDARFPDTLTVTGGCEVSTGSITDVPFRGRAMFHTAFPRLAANITRSGRFYGRDNPAGRAQSTFSPATSIMNSAAWLVAIETRVRAADRDLYRELFTAFGAFDVNMYVRIEGGGATNGGKVGISVRVGGTIASIISTSRYDTGTLLRIGVFRNSAGSFELWVNGVDEGTSATNPGTSATASAHCVGNWALSSGEPSEPALASVRAAYLTGTPPATGEEQAVIDALNGTGYSGSTFQFRSWLDTATHTTATALVEMQAAVTASGIAGIGARGRARVRGRR